MCCGHGWVFRERGGSLEDETLPVGLGARGRDVSRGPMYGHAAWNRAALLWIGIYPVGAGMI